MEFLLALAIFLLAGGGLALGLLLGRGPVRGSCGGLSCIGDAACDGCPRKAERATE